MFCINLILGSTYALLLVTTASFFMACGLYIRASVVHFQTILSNSANTFDAKSKADLHLQMKSFLIEAVDFHNTTKRWDMPRYWAYSTVFSLQDFWYVSWFDEWHNIFSTGHGHRYVINHVFQPRNGMIFLTLFRIQISLPNFTCRLWIAWTWGCWHCFSLCWVARARYFGSIFMFRWQIVRIRMVQTAKQSTEIHSTYHCRCTATANV